MVPGGAGDVAAGADVADVAGGAGDGAGLIPAPAGPEAGTAVVMTGVSRYVRGEDGLDPAGRGGGCPWWLDAPSLRLTGNCCPAGAATACWCHRIATTTARLSTRRAASATRPSGCFRY